jgi:hypothetical protein
MREQVVTLEHDSDFAVQCTQIPAFSRHAPTVYDDFTGIDGFQAIHASQECALARAASTDNCYHFAFGHIEIDAVEDRVLTEFLTDLA